MAHLRNLQKGNTWRLRRDYAPAEWGGYNERKRDRHTLRCSHVTPPSPRLWRTRLLTCSYPPLAVRAPQILQLSDAHKLRGCWLVVDFQNPKENTYHV